jgi:hypothetical protein
MPDDVHEHMSWWASFNEEGLSGAFLTDASDRKRKAREEKKKRKMTKASRKKNRR